MNIDLAIGSLALAQSFFGRARHCRDAVEHANYGGTLCSPVPNGAAKGIVRGNAALPVCGARERHLRRIAGNKILDLDCVSDRENVGIVGLQEFIDADATSRPHFQARIDRQFILRAHADSQDDQLRRQTLPGLQAHYQSLRHFLEAVSGLTEQNSHAFDREHFCYWSGHFLIERR